MTSSFRKGGACRPNWRRYSLNFYLIKDSEDKFFVFPNRKEIASDNFLYCFCSRKSASICIKGANIENYQLLVKKRWYLIHSKFSLLWIGHSKVTWNQDYTCLKQIMFQLYKFFLPCNIRDAVLCSVINVLCTVCTLEPVFILSEYVQAALGRKLRRCTRFYFHAVLVRK